MIEDEEIKSIEKKMTDCVAAMRVMAAGGRLVR
jgi:hypothetical protein